MSIEQVFGNFFKAEVKTSGSKLFTQDKVSISSGSDTEIQAYVRVAPPFKVHFSAGDISSESFTAECSCPVAKKSRLCKHIWATLLCVELKYPDFLSAKQNVDLVDASLGASATPESSFQASAKLRATEYRKEQYQKQKLRAKELKRGRSGGENPKTSRTLSPDVESALAYFATNGFPMPDGPCELILAEAKRKLSRVFHPDRGGTHEEVVELNQYCEILFGVLR